MYIFAGRSYTWADLQEWYLIKSFHFLDLVMDVSSLMPAWSMFSYCQHKPCGNDRWDVGSLAGVGAREEVVFLLKYLAFICYLQIQSCWDFPGHETTWSKSSIERDLVSYLWCCCLGSPPTLCFSWLNITTQLHLNSFMCYGT